MADVRRYEDWPLQLSRYIESVRERPFEWGQHDCALMAAGAIKAMTCVDVGANVRGTYSDAKGAALVMQACYGVRELAGVAQQLFGEPIAPALAQRGDLLLIDVEHGPALGICLGTHAAAPGARGMILVPMAQWITGWRV